jgi:hypothetical protein
MEGSPMRRARLRIAAGGLAGTGLALAALTWLAPGVLACTNEDSPVAVDSVVGGTNVAVEGTIVSATGGGGTPVTVQVSVERRLKGTPSGTTVTMHDGNSCPFHPASGDRVVVAATADGQLTGAWELDGETAVPWIPTKRELTTLDAIQTAFGPPETASPAATPLQAEGDPRPAVLLFAMWTVGLLIVLEARSMRRGT